MSLLRRIFFNFRYFGNPPWDTGVSPPELLAFIKSHSPGRALDIGCGTGTNVITLAQNGWSVVGIDLAYRAIRIARQKARQAGIEAELMVGDITHLKNVLGCFDLILDMGCFHGLEPADRIIYLHRIEQWLSPQGVLLMYAFIKSNDDQGIGLNITAVRDMEERFSILERQDGFDHGQRTSAWLTIQHIKYSPER